MDKVFVISLPGREDRRALLKEELDRYNFEYEIWWATGHENGIVGLLLSIKTLFNHCLANGYSNVLVLEDDNSFVINPTPFLNKVVPQLPEDYHCLYLGLNLIAQPSRYSENLLKISAAYSTHSILWSKTGMELVLTELEKGEVIPFDILLMQRLQPAGHSFASYPMIATQRPSYSDIDRCQRDWGVLMNVTYSMHTKKLNKL